MSYRGLLCLKMSAVLDLWPEHVDVGLTIF